MSIRDDALAAFARGERLFEEDRNYSGAYEAFQHANELMPSAAAQTAMGMSARAMGNCQQALAHFYGVLQTGGELVPTAQADFAHCAQQVGAALPTAEQVAALLPVAGEDGEPLEQKAQEILSAVTTGFTEAFSGAATTFGLPSDPPQNGEEAPPTEPSLQVNQASMLPAGALPWVAGGLIVLAAGAGLWALWSKKGQ